MTTRISQRPARRTLVLALGQRGLAIATAFQRRLAERSWTSAYLATVALVDGNSEVGQPAPRVSGGLHVIPIDGYPVTAEGPGADQNALRQQVLASGQTLSAVLVERLMGISRVQPTQGPWGAAPKLSPEVDVVLTCALDEPLAGACLLDATYLVRHLVHQRLNAAPQMAALLLRPPRLWRMARQIPEVQRLAAAYAALLLRQSFLALEVLRFDLVTAIYDTALEAADRRCAWLAALKQSTAAAASRLLPVPPAPCGALGFGLEQSVLTPETTAALYSRARGSLADLLTDVASGPDRLSGWPVADPDGEDMAGVYLACTRQRCAGPLRALTIDRLIVDALPDPRARLEALAALAESASPFLAWDETKLRSLEHDVLYSCWALGLGEGAGSLALADTGEVLFAQVAQTGNTQRVTALSMVQGLTLDALVGWGENTTADEDSGWSEDGKWPDNGELTEGGEWQEGGELTDDRECPDGGEGTEDSQGSDDQLWKRGNDDATH